MIKWIKDKIIWLIFGSIALASTMAILPDEPIVIEQPIVVKTITEKIKDDGIEFVLKDKTNKEKSEIKSKELSKVKITDKFTENGIEIEIVGDITEIKGGIQLFAKAWKNGEQIGFGKDRSVEIERFRFYNPPVLVDDKNGDIIREVIDQKTLEPSQRKLRYDPQQAIKNSLNHTISLVAKDDTNIIKGKVGNTTSTFYPAAGANSPVDGYIDYSPGAGANWSSIRTTTTGSNASDVATQHRAVMIRPRISPTWDVFHRSIFLFDTAAIDPDAVDSAIYSVYATGAATDTIGSSSVQSVRLVTSNPASNAAIATTDYDYGDFGTTALATDKTFASISGAGYLDFTLNATGKSNITVDGITKFGMRVSADADNSEPTGYSKGETAEIWVYYADETGTDKDPKLVVEHSAPVSRRIIMIE